MNIDAYNVYEIELGDNKSLKVDCSYEDVSIISTLVNNEITYSFDVTPDYLSAMAKAIAYVLKLNNKDIKVTRNISNEPSWRYSILFYNNILALFYIEDGCKDACSKIEIKIEDNEIEKLMNFFDIISNLEKSNGN